MARYLKERMKVLTEKYKRLRESDSYDIEDNFEIEDNILVQYLANEPKVKIPDSVTEIGSEAFFRCNKIEEIIIPDSVTFIRNNAFFGCTKLKKIVLSNSLTDISPDVFYGCKNLREIKLPESLTSVGSCALRGCGIEYIELPESIKKIGTYAFENCVNLRTIKIPASVIRIANTAFESCSYLETIYYYGEDPRIKEQLSEIANVVATEFEEDPEDYNMDSDVSEDSFEDSEIIIEDVGLVMDSLYKDSDGFVTGRATIYSSEDDEEYEDDFEFSYDIKSEVVNCDLPKDFLEKRAEIETMLIDNLKANYLRD